MKRIFYILIFAFLGVGCKTKSPGTGETTELIVESDTTVVLTNADVVEEERTGEKCSCNDYKLKNGEYGAELRFDEYFSNRNDSILSVYSTDSLRLSVKSLVFSVLMPSLINLLFLKMLNA